MSVNNLSIVNDYRRTFLLCMLFWLISYEFYGSISSNVWRYVAIFEDLAFSVEWSILARSI